jgi:transposase
VNPHDPEAQITKMKDGTTHLAYKAEHVVDLDSDLILAAEICQGTEHDSHTLTDSVMQAQQQLRTIGAEQLIEEVVADKGYHSADSLDQCQMLHFRTYIPEPKRTSDWTWTDKSPAHQHAVHGNRQRVRRSKGKRLQRRRSELCERTFAHVCDTGGMRRTWLKGLVEVTKRYVIAAAAHNLGRILRTLFGVGKPRALQGFGETSAAGLNPLLALRFLLLITTTTARFQRLAANPTLAS